MPCNNRLLLSGAVSLPLLVLSLAGCAAGVSGHPVAQGDQVGIHFTCRLPDGGIAASTRPAEVADRPLSPLYLKRNSNDPLLVTAGSAEHDPVGPLGRTFEQEVIVSLREHLVGARQGETLSVGIAAEPAAGSPAEQLVKIARIRTRPKQLRLSPAEYRRRTGKEPAPGDAYLLEPLLPGKVAEVTADEVLLSFSAPPGNRVSLDFGPGVVREREDHFEIEIQAVKGTLVRAGGMVGRIAEVDSAAIQIDYSQPFAGELLSCDVTVESVRPGASKEGAASPGALPASGSGEAENAYRNVQEEHAAQGSGEDLPPAPVAAVQSGDLVTVHYTAALEDGALFSTTRESAAKDPAVKKVPWFQEPRRYGAEEAVAGRQELLPGLGEALIGMRNGEKKQLRLAPEQAFGLPDPQKQVHFPCVRELPRIVRLPADEYVQRFSSFPVLNKEIDLVPYFKGKVTEVTERDVQVEFLARNGDTFQDSYGTVAIGVREDRISTTLTPVIGAQFPLPDGEGVISATDGATFTVDGNHPLAGKTVLLELELASVTPAASLDDAPLEWSEDLEHALARAREEKKPVLLVLYADWCGWSKKTFAETIPDPRIRQLKERFVWAKIDSDKQQKYKEQYGQEGFPMTLVLDPDGKVLKKIEGYRDARALKELVAGL